MSPFKSLLGKAFSFLAFSTPLLAAPNVIVVLTDDLGYGDIYNLHQNTRDDGSGGGIAGDGIINGSEEAFIYTPHIDRMAAEGAKLTRHYTSAPVCAPARGSILQGRDQGHANIRDNSFDKEISDNHTLGTVMQESGYYTACVGKWGVGGSSLPYGAHPTLRGFDYFYGYMEHLDGHNHYPGNGGTVFENTTAVTSDLDHAYTTDLWTAKAKSIIQDRANNHAATPFFLYLAFDAPHAQLQVPTQAYPAGLGTTGGLTWPLNTNSGTDDSYIHPDYASLGNAASRHATMVRRIDTAMGDILQTLRDLSIDDNTLVIFTSDNGTHNEAGSGGSVAHNPRNFDSYGFLEGIKRDTWEGGIRMPTFAWWPTKIGDNDANTLGLNSVRPSAFWDWMPTIVDAAGVVPPAWSSGVSLLPELTGSGVQQDKGYLYFEYFRSNSSTPTYADFPNHGGESRGEMQVIFLDDTDGKRYKGIRTGITDHADDFQIYDVDADQGEGTNLAASKVSLQQEMKDKVLRVRTDGDYTRAYMTSEFAPPVIVTSSAAGLTYKEFTGNWNWVPETDYLTPTILGTTTSLDLAVRTQDDNIALEFTGYISVPTEGTYTFQMTTDSTVSDNSSAAMMWIHDTHVIDDDFDHDGSAKSGTMRLQAGKHPIRIIYKHTNGNHDIDLQYSGPSIVLQPVPDSAFSIEEAAPAIPQANADSASTDATDPVTISVLTNDTDDGAPTALNIQSVGSAAFGSAVISGDTIIYTANSGQYGTDQFIYTITDGLNTATAVVTVSVQVPSSDLWYPLNETSGSLVQGAGGSIDGVHFGIADSEAAHIVGKHGYALNFDGDDDQVNLTGVTLPEGSSERTVSAWIRTSATTNTENQVIFGYGVNTSGKRFNLRLDTSNGVNQTLRLEVQSGFIYGSTVLNDGQWHHVAVVVSDFNNDGSTNVNETKLYVDGVLEVIGASRSQEIDTDTASETAVIGASSHSTDYNFTGDIDEVHVYSSVKTDTDIADLYALVNRPSDAWLYRYFGDNPPSLTSDDDLDGYSLHQEYALGGNPHLSDAPIMAPGIELNTTTSNLEVFFNRRITGSHDVSYTVQASSDIINWAQITSGVASAIHASLGSDFDTVTYEIDPTSPQQVKQFFRIQTE